MAEPTSADMRFIVLHGKDSYLIVERLHAFARQLEERFGRVDRFDLDGATAQAVDVFDELRTFGLMATHKLVVVDRADQFVGGEERRRALERYAEEPVEHATLVLRSEGWRPGNLDKLVAKIGAVIKCEPPGADAAAAWCEKRGLKQHGVTLAPDVADALVERVGTDLARLDMELAKFGAYLAREPDGARAVTVELITALVGQSREEAAWEVQEAVLGGRPAQAVRKVRELVEISQAPEQLILWSLVDLARKLHDSSRMLAEGAAEGAVSKQVKLWGPSMAPTLRAARALGPTRAARLFADAIDLDRRSKSGLAGELPRTLEAFASDFATRCGARR
jgi:DNA polymerase-3 subunit delta